VPTHATSEYVAKKAEPYQCGLKTNALAPFSRASAF